MMLRETYETMMEQKVDCYSRVTTYAQPERKQSLDFAEENILKFFHDSCTMVIVKKLDKRSFRLVNGIHYGYERFIWNNMMGPLRCHEYWN